MGDGLTPDVTALSFRELMVFFGPKILFAVFCGGIIGLERELKNKSAGIKTNMLICVGAAIYTALSILVANRAASKGFLGDPGRVAAQIVSGIGFLGGGAIIQSRGSVFGLTTAATIWVVAAIGIAIGLGHSYVAVATSVLVVAVLAGISVLENWFLGGSRVYHCEVTMSEASDRLREAITANIEENGLSIENFDLTKTGDNTSLKLRYRGSKEDHRRTVLILWKLAGVVEIKHD